MSDFKHIIAATDLSPASRHASARAALLARSQGARLTLVHALSRDLLDELAALAGNSQPAQALESASRERLQAIAADLAAHHGITVDSRLLTDPVLPAIAEVVRQTRADLVVAGTRGASFLRGTIIGSTAERIASRTATPVLMVREAAWGDYRRLLVPVDFSPASAAALQLARRMAPHADIVLMHAVELQLQGRMRLGGVSTEALSHYRQSAIDAAHRQLDALAKRCGWPSDRLTLSLPSGGAAWTHILQEQQEQDCDLIVIGRQGRHALADALLGSTTRMVLAESAVDVLVSVHCDAPGT